LARCFIGTSGWHYDHWRSRFYPEKLADRAKRPAALATNLKAAYSYFNNDTETFAVKKAITLRNYPEDSPARRERIKSDKP